MTDSNDPRQSPDEEQVWDQAFARAFGGPGSGPGSSVLERLGIAPEQRAGINLEDPDPSGAPVIKPGEESREVGSDRYHVVGEIARGGVGVVFKGRDMDLGRDVAMKVLRKELADRPGFVERFVEEAQVGGQLQHPGIVPVYEIGIQEDGRPFFAMKLIKGKTLTALLGQRKDTASGRRRFLSVFEQVCQTIAYAHARKVIHRDLKPSNVMVGPFGEVLVVDWGFAKVLREGGIADETRAHLDMSIIETVRSGPGSDGSIAGSVMGTPAYMAPEQARGDLERLDQRTDVFALGGVLCEILTGLPPYPPGDDGQLVQAALAKTGPAFERLDACGADDALVDLARRCLDADPHGRPNDAGEIALEVSAHLAAVEDRAEAARREAQAARIRAEADRKRRKLTLALSFVSVLAIAIGAGAFLWVSENERAAREKTASEVSVALVEAGEKLGTARSAAVGELAPWPDAVEAARAAHALALAREADADTLGRATAFLASVEEAETEARDAASALAADEAARVRLTAVRMMRGKDFKPEAVDAAFAVAFKAHGLDVEASTVEEVVTYVEGSRIRSHLFGALERWAHVCADHRPEDVEGLHRLRESVRRLDPDPWRTKVRLLEAAGDRRSLNELVEESDLESLPVESSLALSRALTHVGAGRSGRDVLAGLHPVGEIDDLWVAFEQAAPLLSVTSPNPDLLHPPLERALELAPDAHGLRYHLAPLLRLKGDVDAALAELQVVHDWDPQYGEIRSKLLAGLKSRSSSLLMARRHGAAEAVGRRVLAIDGEDAAAWNMLGHALLGRFGSVPWSRPLTSDETRLVTEAVEAIRRALKLEPALQAVRMSLGTALVHARRIEEAGKVLESVPPGDMGWWNARLMLGSLLEGSRGDVVGAERHYREALHGRVAGAKAIGALDTLLYQLGRNESRLKLARAGIGTAPLTPSHFTAGSTLIALGRLAEAQTLLTPLLRFGQRTGPALEQQLGLLLALQGKSEEAVAHWEVMLEKIARQVERWKAMGRNNAQVRTYRSSFLVATIAPLLGEHPASALWLLRKAREELPDSADLFQKEIGLLLDLDRADEAAAMCLEKLENDPYDASLGALTAAVLKSVQDLSKRLAAWEVRTQEEPDNPLPLILLGLGHWAGGETTLAVGAFDRLKAMRPSASSPYHWIGTIHLAAGENELAEVALRELLKRDSSSARNRLNLAVALGRLGKHEEALELGHEALDLAPALTVVRYLCGRLALTTGDIQGGIRYAVEQCLVAPRGLGWHGVKYTRALVSAGAESAAVALCEDVLARQPESVLAKIQLGWIISMAPEQGDVERAVKLTGEAVEILPDSALAWDAHAAALSRAGQHKRAVEAFDRSLALSAKYSKRSVSGFLRAASLWHLGRRDDARAALKECRRSQWSLSRHESVESAELMIGNAAVPRLLAEVEALVK